MRKRRSVLKTATAAALTGLVLTSVSPAYAGTLPVPASSEEAATTPENGWSADGLYWYEDGVKQGTEGRGKEIYDPASGAWYWLDAIDNGKKAVSKDVYQESFAGAYAENEDGTGKWVRYDENGHMIKGWSENEDGKYYFDPVTGAMAKGEAVINGTTYVFDETTGIMKDTGWYSIDGNDYWCEDGVKQGLEGRGKEIYDPASDGWYWLDAVDNGKKAVSKDVYQESFAGVYADKEDGTGKWVRYDENGKMIKGWNENAAGRYYFDPETGAMVKGIATVDGVGYKFDKTTGVLVESGISTTVIQVVHHDIDRTGATEYSHADLNGLVGYIEYLTVQVDNDGNITEPVYGSHWIPDDWKGFTSGYIITSEVFEDGEGYCSADSPQKTDIRPYIKDGVVNLYMSWFMI